jgi:hypothetical protein
MENAENSKRVSSLLIIVQLNLGISFGEWYRIGAKLLAKTDNLVELPARFLNLRDREH